MEVQPENSRSTYFLVMPGLPIDGHQLFAYGVGNGLGYAQGSTLGYLLPSPAPHVIVFTEGKAHIEAQRLAKQHNCCYYVSKISMQGMYVPPPAEWKALYTTDVWKKPDCICGICNTDPGCKACNK